MCYCSFHCVDLCTYFYVSLPHCSDILFVLLLLFLFSSVPPASFLPVPTQFESSASICLEQTSHGDFTWMAITNSTKMKQMQLIVNILIFVELQGGGSSLGPCRTLENRRCSGMFCSSSVERVNLLLLLRRILHTLVFCQR